MKILLATTFRNLNNKRNVLIQKKFLKSLDKNSANIELCIHQFGERKIKNFIKKNFKGKFYFKNKQNKQYKWSHTELLKFTISKFIKKKYDALGWCSSDLFFEEKFVQNIKDLLKNNTMLTYFPNISNKKNNSIIEFGLDIFLFKINKKQAKKVFSFCDQYPNYNWGVFEHYLFSISAYYKMKIINFRKYCVIFKNDNIKNKKTMKSQIQEWKINKNTLIKMLKKNNISTMYISGSMYYLAYKMFNFKSLNLEILKIYILLTIKFVFRLFKINI